MTFKELYESFYPHKKYDVEFRTGIEDFETIFERRCKATIYSIVKDDEHCYKIIFDFSEFEDYNKKFYTPGYYDKDGTPTLYCYQTRYYPSDKLESCYFNKECNVEDYFTITDKEEYEVISKSKLIEYLNTKCKDYTISEIIKDVEEWRC